ncbi:DUF3093 domain-containing protein [Mycolicibacter heraklionensis]|uniref:DUF3093 domain-containing protein n=1 Tax=Mycolicibacter heraklionensis TaxID=512402 RepID=A0A9X7WDH3_9MYCO|nr:DUF3093 domain-containing protein [Mycolicibacter heraklionensis]QZA06133.1 DUF3093 domain-containing protein [Mycolicibacter heraklionensis]
MSGSRLNHRASQTVRYSEQLWVPWWWWPLGFLGNGLMAYEVRLGLRTLPGWLPFAVFFAVTVAALLWLGRIKVQVIENGGETQLWAGDAHLPATVIARSAEVPRTAKSAALGRQLDPAAYVLHRGWVGPMILVVLNDPDDPTPYWLVSCRNPQRMLAALRT